VSVLHAWSRDINRYQRPENWTTGSASSRGIFYTGNVVSELSLVKAPLATQDLMHDIHYLIIFRLILTLTALSFISKHFYLPKSFDCLQTDHTCTRSLILVYVFWVPAIHIQCYCMFNVCTSNAYNSGSKQDTYIISNDYNRYDNVFGVKKSTGACGNTVRPN